MPKVRAVTVYLASSSRAPDDLMELARELGWGLAERDWTLVYGGARVGLMGALADATLAAGGRVEGVILDTFSQVAHAGLHELETVTDMRARKASLAHRGDAFVVLPGAFGTLEEVSEILVERQIGRHTKPLILVNHEGFWGPLLAQFDRMVDARLLDASNRELLFVVEDVRAALDRIQAYGTEPTLPR